MSYRDSDLDYKERMYGPDEAVLAERQAEEAREQRWAEFVIEMRQTYRWGWPPAIAALYRAMRGRAQSVSELTMFSFAQTEGWDGVLNALARAMREDEQYRKELVDRR